MDAKPYNVGSKDITWEDCTLRRWLNEEFLKAAFSDRQQSAILITTVDNGPGQGYKWKTDGGKNTKDKIFLLSYAEAHLYLGVASGDQKNLKSRVSPTNYAISHKAFTNDNYHTKDGNSAVYWWLRSPGYYQYNAAAVSISGALDGNRCVVENSIVVRPVFWFNLDSGIF